MTDKKDKGPERGSAGGGAEKRPHATIEIKASEVREIKSEPITGGSAQSPTAAKIVAAQAAINGGTAAAGVNATMGRVASAVPPPAGAHASREPEPRAARPVIPPPAATAGGGIGRFVSHLTAGVAGGALALLGGQQLAPLLGLDTTRPQSVAVSGLSPDQAARIANLEKQVRERLAAADAPKPAMPDPNAGRIDDLSKQLADLSTAQQKLAGENTALREEISKQGEFAAATDRLAKLEEQLSTMTAAAVADPQRAGRLPQLAQLTGQVADLRSAIDTRFAAQRKELLADIETRANASSETAAAAREGTKRVDQELNTARTETARLVQRVDQLKGVSDKIEQTVKGLETEAAGIKTALEAARGDLAGQIKGTAKPADVAMAMAPIADKVQKLETSVQGVMRAEEDRKSNTERIVLSLELGNLKRALDRGQAYTAELAEVRKVAGQRVNLAALERFQNEGVPTVGELGRVFRATVSNAVIDADLKPADGTVVDRLLAGAKTVVRVKKTSYAADDASAEAVVSRMETALKDMRLADVASEAAKLSEKAAKPAQDWLKKVEARRSIETSLAEIDAQLKASLGAGPAGAPAQKGTK